MVERIMLFKLHDSTKRDQLAQRAVDALSTIDDIEELSVGVPADAASEKSWDLSVVLGVTNLALLDTVLEGARFTAWVDGVMNEHTNVLKAWTFDRLT